MITLKKIISSIYVTEEEFITASGTLQTNIDSKPDTLLDLIDTPDAYDDEKYLRSTTSGTEWATISDVEGSYYKTNFELLSLDATNISNKYIDLAVAPKTDDSLQLIVQNGLKGILDTDYTVSGTRVDWSGKEWEDDLEEGDKIEVVCWY